MTVGLVALLLMGFPGAASGDIDLGRSERALSQADRVALAYQRQVLDPEAYDWVGAARQPALTDTGSLTAAATDVSLPPSLGGRWDYLPSFPGNFNAIHAITGPNGKTLLVAGSGMNPTTFAAGTFTSYIWNPATGTRRMISTPDDLFCSGHVLLPDGRALIGGGTTGYKPFKGANVLYAFNFYTERYEKFAPLQVARWYPATVTGPDGRVLFISGLDHTGLRTNTTEVFDPRTNTHKMVPSRRNLPTYARVHLAANGKFYVAERSGSGFWDPYANTFKAVGGVTGPAMTSSTAASCFVGDVRDQNLMVLGGGWPATDATTVVDLDAATPTKKAGPALLSPKAYVGCVNLPDGTLLEANGGTRNSIPGGSTDAAILTSINGRWNAVNSLPSGEHRLYHSMLYLMDDGRVLSVSSNPQPGPFSRSVIAYSPPYLFKGARPVITSAPRDVTYGGTYPVAATTTGAVLSRVTVTTPASVTHSMDNNQRYVNLPVTNGRFTMPTSSSILPPGWYRLWAVDSAGRPSVAHWMHLGGAGQGGASASSATNSTTRLLPSGADMCCCCGSHVG